jgi:hypothetical protein
MSIVYKERPDPAEERPDPAVLPGERPDPSGWPGIWLFLDFLWEDHFRLYICEFILNYFSIYFILTIGTI